MGRGSELEDISILVGLGIVGAMVYLKYFPGKSFDEVLQDIDTRLKGFLDTIKLPALPPIPTISMPQIPQAAATPPPPPINITPPSPPATDEPAPSNNGTPESTNTIPEDETEPKVNEPVGKPKGSGQVPTNPKVPPPPAGSGGALIAFAGDWDSNSKSQQTSQIIDKQGCQMIIGVGDYSYSEEKAATWFDKIVGTKWRGKFKGCLGNHDVHDKSGFLSIFGQTGWNVGAKVAPNLSVVFIDTESGITEALLTSLTTSAKSQSKHVAYVFHKPFITSGNGHHKPSENKWGSIIDKVAKANGVKLLIAGHNHLYEHFTCGGIHYVTSGAAGRKFYAGNCQGSCGPVKCVENTNGFLKVAVGATLRCQFISNSGQELDTFDIS